MSKRKQPQRLPPPIMHGHEAIDSESILSEHPGELGLLLWKTVRGVRLWAELPDAERSSAFDPAAHGRRIQRIGEVGAPAEIEAALIKGAGILQPRARTATVAKACREIAEWAANRRELGTAIEFMQAAAVVLPDNAEIAHEAGRLARTRTEYARAEMWYRQAVSRARNSQNWYEFSRSYIGLGKVYLLRGSHPQARKSFIRGLRAAKRYSMRSLAASAYHDLTVLAIKSDRLSEATSWAGSALRAYGRGHSRLPALAHDYGVFLLKQGHFDAALRTFLACPPDFGEPSDRLARAAATVVAAGALQDEAHFSSAWSEAETVLAEPSAQVAASSALLDMARGAASMRKLDLAAATGMRGLELATAHAEFRNQQVAEALLQSIENASKVQRDVSDAARATPDYVAGAVTAFESALLAKSRV